MNAREETNPRSLWLASKSSPWWIYTHISYHSRDTSSNSMWYSFIASFHYDLILRDERYGYWDTDKDKMGIKWWINYMTYLRQISSTNKRRVEYKNKNKRNIFYLKIKMRKEKTQVDQYTANDKIRMISCIIIASYLFSFYCFIYWWHRHWEGIFFRVTPSNICKDRYSLNLFYKAGY